MVFVRGSPQSGLGCAIGSWSLTECAGPGPGCSCASVGPGPVGDDLGQLFPEPPGPGDFACRPSTAVVPAEIENADCLSVRDDGHDQQAFQPTGGQVAARSRMQVLVGQVGFDQRATVERAPKRRKVGDPVRRIRDAGIGGGHRAQPGAVDE